MNYLSLKGIKQALHKYSQSDPNLKSFSFGQIYDVNGKPRVEQLYPSMHVSPVSAVPVLGKNGWLTVNRNFQIIFYDVKQNDDSNELQVISDCEELSFRFMRWLMTGHDPEINVISSPTITPFTDKFLDDVAGVMVDFTIEFSGNNDDCSDPNSTTNINFI